MRTFLEIRGDVQRLALEKDPKVVEGIVSSIVARMEVWNPLPRLAHMRSRLSKETADWFIDQPNVLILGAGLPIVNADKAALVEFIDIASNSIGVRPDPALNAFQIRLRQGVVDTVAEQVALSGTLEKGENTATTFPLDAADAWQLIGAHDLTAARKLDWPDDVVARLAEDIEAGYTAYVPKQAFENGGRARRGWWRVDPLSGETVGVMDTGLHATFVEERINTSKMTLPEIQAYRANNLARATPVRRRFARFGEAANLSRNDRILMQNMNDVEKALRLAGLL